MAAPRPAEVDRPTVTVGVLVCDHLDPEVQAHHPDYPERYLRLLAPAPDDPDPTAREVPDRTAIRPVLFDLTAGELPDDPRRCDAWLVGGSRLDAHTDEGFVGGLVEFTRSAFEAGVPQVGICFGQQVIGRALGGTVERAVGWGAGVRTFRLTAPAPWMADPPLEVSMVMSHRDQVTRLPPGAELLLAADYCPVGGFRVDRLVFCVQGHPEFDRELSRTLTTRRRILLGDDVAAAALQSLDHPSDGGLVNRWIRRFLTAEGTPPARDAPRK